VTDILKPSWIYHSCRFCKMWWAC